jgi:hypothetical protein
MKIQSYNRFDNTFRFLSAITFVFLAALLIAPNAFAGKCFDKDGNLKPHAKPSCLPAPVFPPGNDTRAWFFDNHGHDGGGEDHGHFGEDSRDFIENDPDFESGDFVSSDLDQGILINTSELSSSSKGNPRGLCRKIEDDTVLFAETYSYGWVDDCRDGDCAIEIRLSIGGPGSLSEEAILALSDGKSNQVDFVFHSVIMGTEPNPFTEPQDIPIHRTVADFKKTGTTRTLVKCEYTVGGWGVPEFHSVPR